MATALHLADLVRIAAPVLFDRLSEDQRLALHAITGCRTGAFGERHLCCTDCTHTLRSPRSCGHRSCPQCQQHAAANWLARQLDKQLPVPCFMVTFTVPEPLRPVAALHAAGFFDAMFACAADTLMTFGRSHRKLDADLGFSAVLHTHSRQLAFHPHLHIVVPGGGISRKRDRWRSLEGRYLFNGRALGRVFRGKLIDALKARNIDVPADLPRQWIVHVKEVGNGAPALKYLSRYLYRGVIAEKDILSYDAGTQQVCFRYRDGKTKQHRTRTLHVVDFVKLVVQHVLPKGYRRVRDYGFMHHNAKRIRARVQLVLRVVPPLHVRTPPRVFTCPACSAPMRVIHCSPRARCVT